MAGAQESYTKWIVNPKRVLDAFDSKRPVITQDMAPTLQLIKEGKITNRKRKVITDQDTPDIQGILKKCTAQDQFERDAAMWYGYLRGGSKGAHLCLHLFAALRTFGVLYRSTDGTWKDFAVNFPGVPLASLLSHGGRILFQLPMSNSNARNVGSGVGAFFKGLLVDPLAKPFEKYTYQTMKNTSNAKTAGIYTARFLTSGVGALTSTPWKVQAAGDDRVWSYISGGGWDTHQRFLATHSTIQTQWTLDSNTVSSSVPLVLGRFLWFTEEKAGFGSNSRDSLQGRHHCKNMALGGLGNMNPFSGMTITKDGSHGHLYLNYRAPKLHTFGCILVGCESEAPGFTGQAAQTHTAEAKSSEYSPTGGVKWSKVPGYGDKLYATPLNAKGKPANPGDITLFVCDLSANHTSEAIARMEGLHFDVSMLGQPPLPTRAAVWDQVKARL